MNNYYSFSAYNNRVGSHTKSEVIVYDIINELNGRKGIGIEDIDEDIQDEIIGKLISIVDKNLKEQ